MGLCCGPRIFSNDNETHQKKYFQINNNYIQQNYKSNQPNNLFQEYIEVENYNEFNINNDNIFHLNCIKSFEAHQEKIACLIELNSKKIATGSYDRTIKIWNINNYKCEKIINEEGNVFCLLEFEENKILCGTSRNIINLWDINIEYNMSLSSFNGHELWINCLAKCNNEFFASGSNDTYIRIWNYYSEVCSNVLKGHNDCVLSMVILNNGKLCSGSADLTIKIWNWEMAICENTLKGHKGWIKCVYQLRNDFIISGSDDKTIKIWKDNKLYKEFRGHKKSVRGICQISEELFASSSFDKTIKIWDINNNNNCIQTLEGHNDNITGIIYHSNGLLISCSNDHYIKIWKQFF